MKLTALTFSPSQVALTTALAIAIAIAEGWSDVYEHGA